MYRAKLPMVLAVFFLAGANAQQTVAPRALLDRYCLGCHSQKLKTGGVALDMVDLFKVDSYANVLERVLRKVRSGEMPPPGLPHPDPSAASSSAKWVEHSLDKSAAANPNPGRPAAHRLNRAEYSNAIRDLLALDIQAGSQLPVDDSG